MSMAGTDEAVPEAEPTVDDAAPSKPRELAAESHWMGSTLPALLLLAVVAVFSPVLQHQFLPWDDHGNIVTNPNLQPPMGQGLARIWSQPYDGLYIPLTYTTWWLEKLVGNGAALAHGVNLLLHAVCAWVVFALLVTLARAQGWRYTYQAAFAGALLFAVHPLQVEPVAWATGRKDLLAGVFGLAATWQYIRWRENGHAGIYGLAFFLFLLALLAKPSAVVVPAILIILDYFIFRRNVASLTKAAAPFLLLAVVWTVVTAQVQRSADEAAVGIATPSVSAVGKLQVAADSLLFYAEKTFWPVGLSPVYDRTVERAQVPQMWIAVVALLALSGYLLYNRRPWAAGAVLFLVALLPVSGLISFHYQGISTVADRYAYVALLGIALIVAWLVSRARWALLVAVLLAMVVGGLSYVQAKAWRNSLSLWSQAVAVAPGSAIVRSNLGLSYGESGQPGEAQKHLEEAIKMKPDFAMAHNNLASLYMQRGRRDEAVRHYEHAVRLIPNFYPAHSALLVTYFEDGRAHEAAESARVVLEHDPDHYQALAVLASVLGNEGKVEEALEMLRQASARNPDDEELLSLLQMAEGIATELKARSVR